MTIRSSQFFNTGYIPEYSNILRMQQGLNSQFINNYCLNYMRISDQNDLPRFNTFYYPIQATPLPTYGLAPIPYEAPCVRWLNLYTTPYINQT